MKLTFYFIILLLCIFIVPANTSKAHKYYTSLAELNYNAETKSVEVSMRVFADDLELALTRRNKRAVYLDKTKDASALVLIYLKDVFELKNGKGEVKALRWIGMETKADVVWLYFEIPMPEGLEGTALRHRLLFDLFEDQVNLVNGKDGGRKLDLSFKRGDDFKPLTPAG